MLNSFDKQLKIHFIGIGGVSMSGIAMILKHRGYHISGSDNVESHTTQRLEDNGIQIMIGQKKENISSEIGLVVYTAAIKEDNPELMEAKNQNIPCVERSTMLGELTKQYENTIAICGTHGKTTTTSMVSSCFIEAKKDPTVQVGADFKGLGGLNYRVGSSEHFIIEACEYVRSFLSFRPKSIIVLNVEEDHLDYYKDIEDIKSAFHEFLSYAPKDGCIVYNHDDANCQEVVKNQTAHLISIGLQTESDWMAKNISLVDGFYEFDAVSKEETISIGLRVPGYHNIYNALATIALCKFYQLDNFAIQNALHEFTGASRRFEFVGTFNGAKIFDDYAHHPTEIMATIHSAKDFHPHKLWVVFEPHTYSRTKTLYHEFSRCFKEADLVILTKIYAAREKDTGEVSSQMLADSVNEISHNCLYLDTYPEIEDYLKAHVEEGDIILTVGAGTITKLGYTLTKKSS